VCGPMSESSFGRARYMMTFTDDYTRKTFVYFFKKKDEFETKFREFKGLVENETGNKIKILRSDNGREYVNNFFKISFGYME
jgi:hypothetical protein